MTNPCITDGVNSERHGERQGGLARGVRPDPAYRRTGCSWRAIPVVSGRRSFSVWWQVAKANQVEPFAYLQALFRELPARDDNANFLLVRGSLIMKTLNSRRRVMQFLSNTVLFAGFHLKPDFRKIKRVVCASFP